MKYTVIIEKGPTSYGADTPDLPGCVAAGDTREEVISPVTAAVADHVELVAEHCETIAEIEQVIINLPEDEHGEIVDWLYKQEWDGLVFFKDGEGSQGHAGNLKKVEEERK